jgi:glucuronate isomerase
MKKETLIKGFAEIMNQYNNKRKEWIEKFGSDKGFDKWFTNQIKN